MTKTLLRRSEAAAFLQQHYGAYTTATLARLAVQGGGPRWIKFGRFPLYSPDDLISWAESRMSKKVQTTSELSSTAEQ